MAPSNESGANSAQASRASSSDTDLAQAYRDLTSHFSVSVSVSVRIHVHIRIHIRIRIRPISSVRPSFKPRTPFRSRKQSFLRRISSSLTLSLVIPAPILRAAHDATLILI
ncbi:hypothetical protein G7Z17_g4817 [Cylindrodendrum hubeiense]|uniref:Uncharacterized protein n=1 Tax=Cylindrodendrum hubeiense TaxID=595255 RepID=A0A9P5HA50_9HYPO|nr:hypothetical protein G7Z17_g4817 [Cylindrodendrum hubeiense]